MAKGRVVRADTQSEEVQELRRLVHSLLHMIETARASITAGATAESVLTAWSDAVATGVDNNSAAIALIVSSGREVMGVVGNPALRERPASGAVVTLSKDSKSI